MMILELVLPGRDMRKALLDGEKYVFRSHVVWESRLEKTVNLILWIKQSQVLKCGLFIKPAYVYFYDFVVF